MKKTRADLLLVERDLADSQAKAQALIMAGRIASAGRRVEKAGELLAADAPLSLEPVSPYVGRGGLKLAEALDAFGVSPAGLRCADIGASTGGFTDCLLQRGASRVYAVDVSTNQIDDRLRRDPRVVLIEKNARNIKPEDFSGPIRLAVMDVSFISILKILPALAEVLRLGRGSGKEDGREEEKACDGGQKPRFGPVLLSLIKPQFEAARDSVGKRGLVRDPGIHREVLTRIARDARAVGFRLTGLVRLKTRGQKGNQEFFGRFELGRPAESAGEARLEPLPDGVLEWISAAVDGAEKPDGGFAG